MKAKFSAQTLGPHARTLKNTQPPFISSPNRSSGLTLLRRHHQIPSTKLFNSIKFSIMDPPECSLTYRRRKTMRKEPPSQPERSQRNPPLPDSDLNSGNVLQLRTTLVPYPFDSPIRMTNAMKAMEAKIKDYAILNPIYPDKYAMAHYLSTPDLIDEFRKIGFHVIFGRPVPVYEKLVREFAYSFIPKYRIVPEDESELDVMEKHVTTWKFRLGGRNFALGLDDLRKAFGVAENLVGFPHATREIRAELWRFLTDLDEDYVPSQLASKIRYPYWKLVHRLIATCIYLRPDGGRFVTQNDYELMCCIRANVAIDPVIIITRALEVPKVSRATYLGGGHFITTLARFIGFSLDEAHAMPTRELGHEEMLRRGFVKKLKTPDGSVWALADPMPPPAPARDYPLLPPAPPSPDPVPASPPPSAGFPELLGRMDALTAKMDSLATYTYDGFRWQGDMMRNIHNHFSIPGFVAPPPHPFWPSSSSHAHSPDAHGEDDDNDMDI